MSGPSATENASTLRRSNYRTAVGSVVSSSRMSVSRRASVPSSGQRQVEVPGTSGASEVREETICDTWSGYLLTQAASRSDKASQRRSSASATPAAATPSAAYVPLGNFSAALNQCIARQNDTWEQVQVNTIGERRSEEMLREQHLKAAASAAPSTTTTAPAAGAGANLENALTATVLQRLLSNSRRRWVTMLSARVESFLAREAEVRERTAKETEASAHPKSEKKTPSTPPDSPSLSATISQSMPSELGLPTADDVLSALADGLNDRSTRKYVTKDLAIEVDSTGINSVGLITVFEPHVQALSHWFPSITPSLDDLRCAFKELDPRALSCTANTTDTLSCSLEAAEECLDRLLRSGNDGEAMAALLRGTIHPSLRRIVYPRALGLPLRVADGRPPFPAEGELLVNDCPRTLPYFLSCATTRGRDKICRRHQHAYSSPRQRASARAIQCMMKKDVLVCVGDSDKYFIYQDDMDVIGESIVVDRGMPVPRLANALQQLGRAEGALEAYVVYLRAEEGGVIQQKAPPVGFFPVAGCSMLMAPVGNITGDTAEQYEIITAMFGQLWGRLQGPTPELLQCCLLFERIVTEFALPATLHATRVLKLPPLRLALQWMLTGFAEVLDPAEVLVFWDWIMAFHVMEMRRRSALSQPVGLARTRAGAKDAHGLRTGTAGPCALWLLPVLAASLFLFRAPLVQQCRSAEDVHAVFATGHRLLARPLIQALLFTDTLTRG